MSVADLSAAPVEAAVKLFLICSKLLLEPADMSLAGPVAEVKEIFSGSNSAGPKIKLTALKKVYALAKVSKKVIIQIK